MTAAETYSVVLSTVSLLASIFTAILIGRRQRIMETKLAEYELEAVERERAARDEADLRAQIRPEIERVIVRNVGGADAINLRFRLSYPNTTRIDPEQGIDVHRLTVDRLAAGDECQIPFVFLREVAVPPLNVAMTWTDAPTGRAREKTIPCY